MKKYLENLKESKVYIFIILMFSFLTYGYEITNFTLTIDEEIWSYCDKNAIVKAWIGDGRWGIALWKAIFPTRFVLPFFNGLLAVCILTVCAVIFFMYFKSYFENKAAAVISACVFLTMPLHTFYLMFDTFSVEVAAAYMFAILSGILSVKSCFEHNAAQKWGAFLLLCFAISIYQSYYQVYIGMVCGALIIKIWKENGEEAILTTTKEYIFAICISIGILAGALVMYGIVNYALQAVFGKSSYVADTYFKWGTMDPRECIQEVYRLVRALFLDTGSIMRYHDSFQLIFVMLLIHSIVGVILIKKRKILFLLAILGLNFSICVNYIVLGGATPLRTLQAIPVYCCIASFLFFNLSVHKFWKKIVVVMLLLCCLYQSAYVVQMFYSENIRQDRDLALVNRVIMRIEELDLGEVPDYPVCFVGNHTWYNRYSIAEETLELSLFNTGQASRIYKWLSVLGYAYHAPTNEQQEQAEQAALDMPKWPAQGSVDKVDDLIIVNIGNY